MLAVATKAKAIKKAAQLADQKKRNKSFGQGLKKGFFSNSKPLEKRNSVASEHQSDIPTIRPTKAKDNLQLPEVQAAMAQMQGLDPKGTFFKMMRLFNSFEEWMTPAFMQKLAKEPKLLQGTTL
jgi:hypothetical protein